MTDEKQIDGTTHAEKDGSGNIVHKPDVVNTEKADITGETFIRASRNNSNTGISSGSQTNIVDTEGDDNRNELNNSQQFNPDETGYYEVEGVIWIGSVADQDRIRIEISNVTDGTRNGPWHQYATSGTSVIGVPFHMTREFTSGKNYEIRADDRDSSFDLLGGNPTSCYLTIKRSVVHS